MGWSTFFSRISANRVTVFADFIDPSSYIGFHNLTQVAQARELAIDWQGFEFNPDTPETGYYLLPQNNSDLRPGLWASVSDFAARSGIQLTEPVAAYNTKVAQMLVHTLPDNSDRNQLILAIFEAYFQRGEDISQKSLLQTLLKNYPALVARGERLLERRGLEATLSKSRAIAIEKAFLGLPGFIYRGKNYFGALSADAWNSILDEPSADKEILCLTK